MADSLATLDELVVRLLQLRRSPAYRRALLDGAPHGLGVSGLRVLRTVERMVDAGGSPTVKDVAIDHAIEQSTASRAVQSVVAAGLVSRSVCGDDQRKSRLDLTPAGREVLARATQNRQQLLTAITADWPGSETDALIALLERLTDGYATALAER